MSRPSFRPRPLDPHRKLPILKSIKDFDDFDEVPTSASTRNSQILRIAATEADEVHQILPKRSVPEIPTPQFVDVNTYEGDYLCTFSQPTSYLRGRGARAEIGDFVEYDLDNEDEDWLEEINDLNDASKIITHERLESILFRLEVFDHKARERGGIIAPIIGSPIPVLLQPDAALEALQTISLSYDAFNAVYSYWKNKREVWQKPILRRLQPPPAVNDTNPYNVFRPREKAHRLHTRRMQRRENDVYSFEKLRLVRRNLEQAKMILDALMKREEKKRDIMGNEVHLQRLQFKYRNEAEVVEESLALSGCMNAGYKMVLSDEEIVETAADAHRPSRGRPPSGTRSIHFRGPRKGGVPVPPSKRRDSVPAPSWLHKIGSSGEPIMLFTKPLDPGLLALAGIVPPPAACRLRGRMGRGGRILFDRSHPLL